MVPGKLGKEKALICNSLVQEKPLSPIFPQKEIIYRGIFIFSLRMIGERNQNKKIKFLSSLLTIAGNLANLGMPYLSKT
jgi:hypothetical protein